MAFVLGLTVGVLAGAAFHASVQPWIDRAMAWAKAHEPENWK